jgi:glutamine amidotransferase
MHNGAVRGYETVMRELRFAVDPSLYGSIEGTTDSETMFYLALTFGLEDDPPGAVERMVGFVEETGARNGIEHPIQMTVATSNGDKLWAFRYSSEHDSRSLFYSTRLDELRVLYPELGAFGELSDESRVVLSEPLGDLPGVWNAVPESSWGVVQEGQDEIHPFTPQRP